MRGKLFLYIVLAIVILLAVFLGIKGCEGNDEEIVNYVPQEEISENQERKTLVTLYFENIQSKDIMPEARLIDSKLLLENPYKTLIELLLSGPKSDKLKSIIPKETELIWAKLEGNVIVLNFNKELINDANLGKENEEKIIETVVNTLTELNEVDAVKILIDGKEDEAFEDGGIRFNENFVRKD